MVAAVHALADSPTALQPALVASGLPSTVQCESFLLLSVAGGCDMSPCYAGALCASTSLTSYNCLCPSGFAGDGFSAACVSCGPLSAPVVTASLQNGTMLFSAPRRFEASLPSLPTGSPDGSACNFTAAYSWSVFNAGGVAVPFASATSQVLATDARTLPVSGSPYTVSARVCFLGNTSHCSPPSSAGSVAIVSTPLTAAVSGGNTAYLPSTAAVLNGSSSIDPDDPLSLSGSLTFAWNCFVGNSSSPCAATIAPGPVVQLAAALQPLSPGVYTFQLVVSKDIRTASAQTVVTLLPATAPPQPAVSIAAVVQTFLSPTASLTLSATAVPVSPSDAISVCWSMSPLSNATATALGAGVLDDPCFANGGSCTVSSTPTSSAAFVLLPGALVENGGTYTLRVTATETGQTAGSAWADIVLPPLARRPQGGSLALIGTANGTALVTSFNLSATGWSNGLSTADMPLSYSFGYVPTSQLSATPTTLTPFQTASSESFTSSVFLPAGNWTIFVLAASNRGAQSTLADAVAAGRPVIVSAPSAVQVSAAAISAGALAGSQPAQAMQLASGIAQTLNAGGANSSNLTDVRANLITNVVAASLTSSLGQQSLSSSGSDAATTSLISTTAATLTALTNASCDLSDAARASALAACSALANSSAAVATAGVAQNTLLSLSSASSCLTTGSSASTLQSTQSALASLVNTSLASLTVPGQAAIQLSSSTISVVLALESVNSSSSTGLFGSNSSGLSSGSAGVGALSASALSGTGYNGSAVQVVFQYTTFDSHSDGSTPSTGVVTLDLSTQDGQHHLNVSYVPETVNITLPPSIAGSGNSGTHAVCAYWDVAAQAYSADGCIGLPVPLPPGLLSSLNSSLNAVPDTCVDGSSSAAARLLRTVQLAGPLMAGCTAIILDCPRLGAAGVAYLNPDDPLSAPSVRCPTGPAVGLGGLYTNAGPPALLVFTGAKCEVWKTPNSAQCTWSAITQSFSGAGCITPAQNATCLCTHLTDYSMRSPPNVVVADPSQMLAISPANLLLKGEAAEGSAFSAPRSRTSLTLSIQLEYSL